MIPTAGRGADLMTKWLVSWFKAKMDCFIEGARSKSSDCECGESNTKNNGEAPQKCRENHPHGRSTDMATNNAGTVSSAAAKRARDHGRWMDRPTSASAAATNNDKTRGRPATKKHSGGDERRKTRLCAPRPNYGLGPCCICTTSRGVGSRCCFLFSTRTNQLPVLAVWWVARLPECGASRREEEMKHASRRCRAATPQTAATYDTFGREKSPAPHPPAEIQQSSTPP